MKIPTHKDFAVQSQALLPLSAPGKLDALKGAASKDSGLGSADPVDPKSFSKFLNSDSSASERGQLSAAKGKLAARDGVRTASVRGAGPSNAAAKGESAPVVESQSGPAVVASPEGKVFTLDGPSSPDSGGEASADLNAEVSVLPQDPRLEQGPAELVLEAAAIAAAQLLAAPQMPPAELLAPAAAVPESEVVAYAPAADQPGSPSTAKPVLDNGTVDQLSLRTLQASLRVGLIDAVQPTETNLLPIAPVLDRGAEIANPSRRPSLLLGPDGGLPGSTVPGGPNPTASVQPSALPLDAALVSVFATGAQRDALALAGKKLATAAADTAPIAMAVSDAALLSEGASTSNLPDVNAQVVTQGVSIKPEEANFAQSTAVQDSAQKKPDSADPLVNPARVEGSVSDSGKVSDSASNSHADTGTGGNAHDSQSSFRDQANGAGFSPKSPRTGIASAKGNSEAGTLGANKAPVFNESTVASLPVEEGSPAFSQVGLLDSVKAPSISSGSAIVPGSISTHAASSTSSSPAILPPVQSRASEVWKVVSDALQRARSENPSHLAVEIRMDDGSTVGLEVRMSGAGLQASFRSESQTLLKTLETQWAAFVAKEPADSKVASAVFEGRTGFGSSTDSSSNGGERRQQMEDAASSASLSRGRSSEGVSGKPAHNSGSAPRQITPSIRTRDGRVSVYA